MQTFTTSSPTSSRYFSSFNSSCFSALFSKFFSCIRPAEPAEPADPADSQLEQVLPHFLVKTPHWFLPNTSLSDKKNVFRSILVAIQNTSFPYSLDDACKRLHEKIDAGTTLLDIIQDASLTGTLCLNGCNLAGLYCSELNLRSTTFDRANLSGATFIGCDLTDASFLNTVLGGTTMLRCNLNRAQFNSSSNTGHFIETSWGVIGLMATTNRVSTAHPAPAA